MVKEKKIINDSEYAQILRQAVAVLPWGHNQLLLSKEELQTLLLDEIKAIREESSVEEK